MSDFLARFGEQLVRNGYAVIPIVAGTKRPPGWMSHEKGDPWSAVQPDIARVRQWIDDKRLRGAGVGINLGRGLFALDIDIRDAALVEDILDWCMWNLPGNPPQRIGLAPKTLLLFRTETAIRKISSAEFLDANGNKAQVEGLGDGEQFVAYAIHPDTKKPYHWPGADLIEIKREHLPLINVAQAKSLVAYSEERCKARGWTLKRRASSGLASGDDDDWTDSTDRGKANLSVPELQRYLEAIPNNDLDGTAGFDDWLNVGMALFHETDGSPDGLRLWCDWSGKSNKHVQAECDRRWSSFDVSNKDRRPITARWIIKQAGGIIREKAAETLESIRDEVSKAKDEKEVRKAVERAKTLDLDPLIRDVFAVQVQRKLRDMLNIPITIGMARALVRYEAHDAPKTPEWLERWVFVGSENVFFNRVTQGALKPDAFDAMFSRQMLTQMQRKEGKSVPEVRPSDFALNIVQIPVVDRRAYDPWQREDLITYMGQSCVNTYTDIHVPKIPPSPSKDEVADVELVKRHVEWVLPDQRERELFLSWLAHVVRVGRVRWSVVLHGVEGVGKTFFFEMMAGVLGPQNARMVSVQELGKEFTSWAEGAQFACIEEVKLHGHNRYDVMNSLKPYITNDVIKIRRMRTDAYEVRNTATYLALTNYVDALPIDNRDRRYMVLSAAPDVDQVQALDADYFADLFRAAKRSAGAIRGWLYSIQPHAEFSAEGRAPRTRRRQALIAMTEREEVTLIRDILDEGSTGASRYLLSTTHLTAAIEEAGEVTPMTQTLNRALSDLGLNLVGRIRVGSGQRSRIWSEHPEHWQDGTGEIAADRVRDWLADDL